MIGATHGTQFTALQSDRLYLAYYRSCRRIVGIEDVAVERKSFGRLSLTLNVPPMVDSKGRIYGIGFDVTQFRVDVVIGEFEPFGREIIGTHSYYTQIAPFRDGQHLVVESLQFYRDGNRCYPKCPMAKDSLEDWNGEHLLWKTDFPANAKLHVQGTRSL